jgi:hypothetical protein
MTADVIGLSARLAAELAVNSRVDPRTVPCRFSLLKQFSQSPLHYWHACQDRFEETLSMRLGSGAHAILFGQPYVVWTGKVRNGKAWDAFEAEHDGALILNQRELEQAQAMAASIRSHEQAMRLLFAPGTVHEQRIDWTFQGRAFRSTPDAASNSHIVDLKCLRSADPDKVMWQSRNMYYHAQAALYRECMNSVGADIRDNYLVVVENKAPYPVTVLRFTDNALDMGMRSVALWMERLRQCEASGIYPGYTQCVVDLDLPGDGLDGFTFAEEE